MNQHTRAKRETWPIGPTLTLKCEDERPCFDQRPFSITLKEETTEAWIGWPLSWQERGVKAGRPLEFPKFAWKPA